MGKKHITYVTHTYIHTYMHVTMQSRGNEFEREQRRARGRVGKGESKRKGEWCNYIKALEMKEVFVF